MSAVDAWDVLFPPPVAVVTDDDNIWGELDPAVVAAREAEHVASEQAEMRELVESLATLDVVDDEDGLHVLGRTESWVSCMEWDEDRQTYDDCGGTETGEGLVAYAPSEHDALRLSSHAVMGYDERANCWFDAEGAPFAEGPGGRERALLFSLHDLRSGVTLDGLTPHYVAVATALFAAGITDTREWRTVSADGIPVEYLVELYGAAA